MRRGALLIAVLLSAAGLALALVPFGPGGQLAIEHSNGTFSLPYRCSAPVLSAFGAEPTNGGNFVVLSPSPLPDTVAAPSCRHQARDRLAITTTLWIAAAAVVLLVRRRPRATSPRVAPA